jgi:hypothetical protein
MTTKRKAKRQPPVTEGTRIRVKCNGMKWSGVEIPRGTVGTVFLAPCSPRGTGRVIRCVRWEGFPEVQANGFRYAIGGTPEMTYCPDWAEAL